MKKYVLVLTFILPFNVFAKDFLFIGDSHSLGAFGSTITSWMRSMKYTFDFYASGGSAPLQWRNNRFVTTCGIKESSLYPAVKRKCKKIKTPSLLKLLSKSEYQTVIIALGTNYSDKEKMVKSHIKFTTKLINDIPQNIKCLWIGPPDMKRFRGERLNKNYSIIFEAIKLAKRKCRLIDSRKLSYYPEKQSPSAKPDGIHYDYPAKWYKFPAGVKEAKIWALNIIHEISTSEIEF